MIRIAVAVVVSLCAYVVPIDPLSAQESSIRPRAVVDGRAINGEARAALIARLRSKSNQDDPKAAMELYKLLINNDTDNINDSNIHSLVPLWQIAASHDDPAAISLIANCIFTGKGGYRMDKVFATRLWQYTASRGDELGTFHFNNLKRMQGFGERRVPSTSEIREGLLGALRVARGLEETFGSRRSPSQSSRDFANRGLEDNATRNQWVPYQ